MRVVINYWVGRNLVPNYDHGWVGEVDTEELVKDVTKAGCQIMISHGPGDVDGDKFEYRVFIDNGRFRQR